MYSNFEGKEELCLEVLKSRYLNELARFMNKVVQSDGSVEGRLAAMTSWISELTDETRFVILTAEYLTSTFSDEGQTAANRELLDRIRDSVGVIIEDALLTRCLCPIHWCKRGSTVLSRQPSVWA